MPPPGNYQIRTNLFVCSVRRFAVGTPGRRALRSVYRTLAVGRDHWARRCRNCQIRTNLFVFTVRRLRGTDGACPIPTAVYRSPL